MGQGPKPAKGKAKPAVARKSPTDEGSRVCDLEKRLAEALQRETEWLKREAEAQAQQIATAEILRVISRSPTDIQSVFETLLQRAVRLCAAGYAARRRKRRTGAAAAGYVASASEISQRTVPGTALTC